MQYTARLPYVPSPRSLAGPAVALAVGAAVATGAWALIDNERVVQEPAKVIVVDTPASANQGADAKHEAATAAAIGASSVSGTAIVKDEAATAAAIGASSVSGTAIVKDEAATAAAIGGSGARDVTAAKDEAATAAAIGGGAGVDLRGSKATASG
jgi:hypothetical protein